MFNVFSFIMRFTIGKLYAGLHNEAEYIAATYVTIAAFGMRWFD